SVPFSFGDGLVPCPSMLAPVKDLILPVPVVRPANFCAAPGSSDFLHSVDQTAAMEI
ncbi:hypothetical protein CF326_g3745, partial [Tilletia indica]